MAIELIEVSRNTRGLNTRKINYMAIGRYITEEVEKESRPIFNEDGTQKEDEEGNPLREKLGKDANGKQITYLEEVKKFTHKGALDAKKNGMSDALELVKMDEQLLLDCFAAGFNEYQYSLEADKDELDEFIKDLNFSDDEKQTFRKMSRKLNKDLDMDLLDAAEMVKNQMVKNMEKAKAAAAAA